jgi:hypothetical protein
MVNLSMHLSIISKINQYQTPHSNRYIKSTRMLINMWIMHIRLLLANLFISLNCNNLIFNKTCNLMLSLLLNQGNNNLISSQHLHNLYLKTLMLIHCSSSRIHQPSTHSIVLESIQILGHPMVL